jgi:hypothetical protein
MARDENTNEYSAIPVKSESLLWKTAKLGAFFGLTGMALKKTKINKDYSDMISFGLVAAGTLLNTDENESYSEDLTALGSVLAIYSGHKAFKQALDNPDFYKKAYSYAEKADNFTKDFNVFTSEVYRRTTDSLKTGIGQAIGDAFQNGSEKGIVSSIFTTVKDIGKVMFDTFGSGIKQLFEQKTNIIRNVVDNSEYKRVTDYNAENPEFVEVVKHIVTNNTTDALDVDVVNNDSVMKTMYKKFLSVPMFSSLKNLIGGETVDEINEELVKKEAEKYYKRSLRYQKISEQSFFKDILGEFIDFADGEKKINLGKIIKEGSNYANALNIQVNDYLEENKGRDQRELTGQDFINWLESKYKTMDDSDDKKQLSDMIKSFYNQDNKVKFSELEKYVGKQISLSAGTEIAEEDRLRDANVINYILHGNQGSSKIFNTAITKQIGSDGKEREVVEITGINNFSILKDFTFTDVVEYGKNKEVIDKTMGNGTLFAYRTMGVLENSINAFYHNGLISKSATIQRWNPTSLLDSANRRKELIANDINRMNAVKQAGSEYADIIIDGINFTSVKTERYKDIDDIPDKVKMIVGNQIKNTYKEQFKDYTPMESFYAFDKGVTSMKNEEKKAKFLAQRDTWFDYASVAYLRSMNNKNGSFTQEEWESMSKITNTAELYELLESNDNIAKKARRIYKEADETQYITQSMKQNNYKHIFRKKIVEAATEEISYAYRNERPSELDDDLYSDEVKPKKTLKQRIRKYSNSEYNFTPFRYNGVHWTVNDPGDDYFMEDNTIVHSAINKIPKLKNLTRQVMNKEVDPNEVKKANKIVLEKTSKMLNQAIDLMEEGGQYSPETRHVLEEVLKNDSKGFVDELIIKELKKFEAMIGKGSYTQEDFDSLQSSLEEVKNQIDSAVKGFDSEGKTDEILLKYLRTFQVKYKSGNPSPAGNNIKISKINEGFFAKATEQYQAHVASKHILKETNSDEYVDLSLENINKKLLELGFLFGPERNTPIKNGAKLISGNVRDYMENVIINSTRNDEGLSLMENITKNLARMVSSGAKTQEEADEMVSEINKFKPLFFDVLDAVKQANEDTFNQGNGNDLKGFIRNEVLRMTMPENNPLRIADDSFQLNLGNRLYAAINRSSNAEILFENDEEAYKKVTKGYELFSNLDDLMSSSFSKKSKEIRAINKRIINTDGADAKTVSTFNDLSLEDKMNTFKNRYYKTNQNQATSVILKTGLDYDISLKNIFTKLREFFLETSKGVEERRKAFEDKILNFLNKNGTKRIKSVTTSFGSYHKGDTVFNARAKGWVSAAETAFEQLGIPRLSNIGRNVTWNERWKDFMLKRVGVISAAALGAMAVDSFTDALIPDQVPIIGNGISGALAWGAASARVGAQYAMNYTGITSIFRGLDSATNGLLSGLPFMDTMGMDAGELYDIHFKGKAVRVNKNRFWHTAGRQSIQGEEFDQYRPSALYTLMNKTTGVRSMSDGYAGKWQKFFRKDFLFTKYPWYMIDPYREERIAYKKYGAVYPMTEQLFKDIPVVGDFMSATIGQLIKPTQLIGKEQWLENGKIKNPDWKPGSDVPKYIEYKQPGIIGSLFSGFEDVKTLAGLQGYAITKGTEFLFGKSNPYERDITLASLTDDISYASEYNKYNLGGIFNLTEPIRRLVDDPNSLNMTAYNPLRQKLPYWMPEYFKKGNNPIMKYNMGSYIGPTGDFNKTMNHIDGNENLNRFRILSMIAPKSKEFEEMRNRVLNKMDDLSFAEKTHYYESLGYAEQYGKREYANTNSRISGGVKDISITIKEKLTPYEFIGTDNKRYKFDTVTKDFNELSSRYGRRKASKMLQSLDNTFQEGQTYNFKIANNATFSAGIDDEGDFLKIDSDLISKKLNLDKSSYRKSGINPLNFINRKIFDVALPMKYEKYMGKKTVFEEWSRESVESNYFRDWDSPIDSFIAPYFTLSSNSFISATAFGRDVNEAFEGGNNTTNFLGAIVNLGKINYFKNAITRGVTTSEDYKEETKVHDKIEQYKLLAGKRNVYQLTGKEYFSQIKDMVNEQDSKMLMDLINVSNEGEREKILKSGNDRIRSILKMIWNRHQKLVDGNIKYTDWRIAPPKEIATYGIEYNSNQEYMKNRIKQNLGYSFSKLDSKRQGIYNAYVQDEEYQYIKRKSMEEFGRMPMVASTIYSSGEMFINNNF